MLWQFIPKYQVLLQTYIEHLRAKAANTVTINHHGRARKIKMNANNVVKQVMKLAYRHILCHFNPFV